MHPSQIPSKNWIKSFYGQVNRHFGFMFYYYTHPSEEIINHVSTDAVGVKHVLVKTNPVFNSSNKSEIAGAFWKEYNEVSESLMLNIIFWRTREGDDVMMGRNKSYFLQNKLILVDCDTGFNIWFMISCG